MPYCQEIGPIEQLLGPAQGAGMQATQLSRKDYVILVSV